VPPRAAGEPTPRSRSDLDPLLKLAVIGTVAGFFSGVFGVGGGTVIVPLLVLWMGYEQREAVGTALAQRLPQRTLALLFSVVLVAAAVELVLQ
jgi:uncharacterized membrane protein YfcA